jgi:hypothetical protein
MTTDQHVPAAPQVEGAAPSTVGVPASAAVAGSRSSVSGSAAAERAASTSADWAAPGAGVHPVTGFVERLTADLQALEGVGLLAMDAREAKATTEALLAARAMADQLLLRMIAACDDKDVCREDGARSTAAWLRTAGRLTPREVNKLVTLATALAGDFTPTRDGMAKGAVNTDQAQAVVAAVNDLPDDIGPVDRRRGERHLVGECASHDAKQIKHLGKHLLEVLAPDEVDRRLAEQLAREERETRRKTMLSLVDNGDGSVSGRFKIPTLHAAMLKRALEAIIAPRRTGAEAWTAPDGGRLHRPEMLGRGFCELLERLPVDQLPKSCGMNATVVVTMTLPQLCTGLGSGTLTTGERLSPGEVRRLACQAGIIPAVLGSKSEVLDLGRSTRFHTRAQRLALEVGQQTCTTTGCDRPAAWCDAHHQIPWSQGGHTTVEAGRLLCPWHHHRAHDPGYDMHHLPDGKVRFTRRQ